MSRAQLLRVASGLLFTIAAACPARALTVPALQQLLQSAPLQTVQFHELRESPWLAAPVETRGTLQASADRLEKRIDFPREETWRLWADRIEWIGADGGTKQIPYNKAPALGALADALRRLVAGDLSALERNFSIDVQGSEGGWTARLLPRGAPASRQLEYMEIQGRGTRLLIISIVERQGERTTTRLQP